MNKKIFIFLLTIVILTSFSFSEEGIGLDEDYFKINIPDILGEESFDSNLGFNLNISLPSFENGYYDFGDDVGIRDLELTEIKITNLPDSGYFSVPSNSHFNLSSVEILLIYKSINYGEINEIEYTTTLDKLKMTIPDDLHDFYYFDQENMTFGFTNNSRPGTRIPIKIQKDDIFTILPIVQTHPSWATTTDLDATIPNYEITRGEILNLEDIKLFAYYDDGTKDELNLIDNPNTLDSYIQYYDRKKIKNSNDYDITSIEFKENADIGEKVTVYFEYEFRDFTIKETVIVTLIESDEDKTDTDTTGTHYQLTDIQEHWAYPYIESLNLQGKLVNVAGDNFYPNQPVTRAEAAGYISNYLELNATASAPFSDIYADAWYYESVGTIYKTGISNGYPDGTFRPNDLISRQELAVLLVKAFKLKEKIIHDENNITPFEDDDKISTWAKQYVYSAKSLGLIEGRPGSIYDPFANMSRGEIVTIIDRMLK